MKREIPPDIALRMLSNKPIGLIGSKGPAGFNAAPVSWLVPVGKTPPRITLYLSPAHLSWDNIEGSSEFTVNIPSINLLRQVAFLGGVSGRKSPDKLRVAGVDAIRGKMVAAPLFPGCLGHLECRLVVLERERGMVTGEVVYALADEEAFYNHWRLETDAGRPLQHLGGEYWQSGGEVIVQHKLREWP